MKVGTKSVLFGAHCFLLHPWFVFAAWRQLYGFPLDPRLWLAFAVHDLGYLGKPNMDGPEGERHTDLGARIMSVAFGKRWGDFCRYHSRYAAKRDGRKPSRLCSADKLAIALTPAWLYLPMARLTGELSEYMSRAKVRAANNERLSAEERRRVNSESAALWYSGVQAYMRRWVEAHKDGAADTWTASAAGRQPLNDEGVWK
jgi:hypothetical protein